MLYKEDKFKDGWEWSQWRYWCECASPDHVLGFDQVREPGLDDQLEVYICSNPHMTFWQRVKGAFKLLFGREVTYLGVMISSQDRKELAEAIRGSNEESRTRPDGQSGAEGQTT